MKLLCKESINKKGERVKPKLFTLKRTKPQQYFPSCRKATIIENKRNRLSEPIGVSYNKQQSSSNYPLYNTNEQQIISSFLIQLSLLPFQPLNMHNIHLWMQIDKSHYDEITQKRIFNKTKIQRERISLREVVYKFNKRCSIEIAISCSKNPFPIETYNDVNNFFIFLGQVKYTLAYILSDPRERILPPVDHWILKYCGFNKDVELDNKNIGKLMNLNIQIKYAGEAFRLYVKNLEDRFVLRGEKVMKVNKSITTFLDDAILNPLYLIDIKFNEFINIVEKRIAEINNNIESYKNINKI